VVEEVHVPSIGIGIVGADGAAAFDIEQDKDLDPVQELLDGKIGEATTADFEDGAIRAVELGNDLSRRGPAGWE
jgi:hypothetical protein